MNIESLQRELESAYKSLDKADRKIKNLLIERRQNKMALDLLIAGEFLNAEKLQQALGIVAKFSTNSGE